MKFTLTDRLLMALAAAVVVLLAYGAMRTVIPQVVQEGPATSADPTSSPYADVVLRIAPEPTPTPEPTAAPESASTPEPDKPIYNPAIPLSEDLQYVLRDVCEEDNVELALALGVIEVESNFDPSADSGLCYSLMQLNSNIMKPCSNRVETNMSTPCSPPAGDAPARKKKSEKSEPEYKPDTFDYFWQRYPKKKSRQAAIRAWDKLRPGLELCRTMKAALKQAVSSPEWAERDGQYIPHFSTWLNQRRWEDEGVDLSLLSQTQDTGGGWADAPRTSS